jgi:hypothetical protein
MKLFEVFITFSSLARLLLISAIHYSHNSLH